MSPESARADLPGPTRAGLFSDFAGGAGCDRLDIERAKAISDVAQTLINSAKVEVEFARLAGIEQSQFLGPGLPLEGSDSQSLPAGIVGIRRHRLAG